MPTILPKSQATALRLHAADVTREIDYDDQAGYELEERSRSELHAHKKTLLRAANLNAAGVEQTNDENELRSRDEAHTAMMALVDAIDDEIDGRQGGNDAEKRAKMRPLRDTRGAASAISEPGQPDYETTDEPQQTFALRSRQRFSDFVLERNPNAEYRGLSVGRYLRAMVTGAKSDLERRSLMEGTDSAGGYTVPEVLSARLIDRMREASVVMRLGAQTVPLTSQKNYIAKVSGEPSPGWREEGAPVVVGGASFERVEFTARSLAVIVKITRELMEDSINLEDALPKLIATCMAAEVDRVALFGSGQGVEPKGVSSFTGLTPSGATSPATLSNYRPFIQARTALRMANSDVTAYVLSPRDEGNLALLTDSTGQPLNIPPAIAKTPMLTTNKVPTNLGADGDESIILAGEWSKLMIGVRSELQIELLKEVFAGTLQYAFIAHLRMDVACEHEAAFTKISGVTPPGGLDG
jgi:HK97 family phage major capsid protein